MYVILRVLRHILRQTETIILRHQLRHKTRNIYILRPKILYCAETGEIPTDPPIRTTNNPEVFESQCHCGGI